MTFTTPTKFESLVATTRAPRRIAVLGLLTMLACSRQSPGGNAPVVSPTTAADELLAVDRNYARAAETSSLIDALSAMFADSVIMGAGPAHAFGKAAAVAALRSNPENPTSRIGWQPIRVGISSDGTHGFTQGYIATTRSNGAVVLGKYLSYWVKQPGGWRVMVYKRIGRPPGDVSTAMIAPSLPIAGLASQPARVAEFQADLQRAEASFSADAAKIGIGPAFFKWGSDDAMNIGSTASWVIGAKAISEQVGAPGPNGARPEIEWSADRAIVAPSGDLGVTIGYIRRIGVPVTPAAPGQPFFTIWKRNTPSGEWRYIAE